VVELLEGINFTAYFPEELLEWNNVYPSDLMYKVFVFMKLRMIPSIPYLEYILNEKFGVAQELVPVIGTALGFYIRIPARDKLYKAHQAFHPAVMEKILENNAELLIKEGIANPEILIGDSTVCRTRKDDPNGVKFHARDSESARVMKFQAIVDPNCIPLGLIPRKGTEHDRKGFNSTKQKLVRLKSIAEKYGIPIKFVLLDSGYFSLEIMQFIEEELGAIPIIDINPMNSKILKLLKERLEYFKQYLREIIRLGVKFPKLAKMCYLRFLEDITKAEMELDHLKGIKPGLVSACLRIFRKIGLEEFITLYRERPVIEGLFGMMKGCYALLGRTDRRLPVKGEDQAYKHGLFILNAMQFLAYFNYRILNTKNHLLRSLYFIKFKEISVLF
jgi:hypothetical protein